jgi:hypothetical protein
VKCSIETDLSCLSCRSGRPLGRAARNQYDTGSNVVISTGKAPFGGIVTPNDTNETVSAADGRKMKISGTFPVGDEVGHVIDEATDNLIQQHTLEVSGLATLLIDSNLHLLKNEAATDLLEQIAKEDIVATIASHNDQYFFSEQVMKTIEQGLSKKFACVARYHTIKFSSLRDLVLFWHHNWITSTKQSSSQLLKIT